MVVTEEIIYLARRVGWFLVALTLLLGLASRAQAQDSESGPKQLGAQLQTSGEHMSAQHLGLHHYSSAADEAQDALLITEVKSSIATADIPDMYAVTVDADHGTVVLTGEVPDRDTALRLHDAAASCDGVRAVKDHLDWPSKRS